MKKEEIVDKLEITKDAALGVPITTIIGGCELYVENFKSITEYENNTVKLLTKCGVLSIFGDNLQILYYDEEEIAIKGHISRIEL